MNRFAISSYDQLIKRLKEQEYVFDCGQISPEVMRQVHIAAQSRTLNISVDSWPVRWLTLTPETPKRTVIEFGTNPHMS